MATKISLSDPEFAQLRRGVFAICAAFRDLVPHLEKARASAEEHEAALALAYYMGPTVDSLRQQIAALDARRDEM